MSSLNYYEIGQRIRKYRIASNFTQEVLAEKVGISTTHMSHIETGNTKLSLSVLVALALALDVHTDDIIFAETTGKKSMLTNSILQSIETCDATQLAIILDTINSLKISLNKHL